MSRDILTALAAANPVPAGDTAGIDSDACLAAAIERGRSVRPLVKPPARLSRPRGLAVAGVAGLVVVASALALGHPTINFFSAKKAPGWEFVLFAQQAKRQAFLSGQPVVLGMELAAPAREITDVNFGGHDHELVVAPLKNGGLCRSWSYVGSACGPVKRNRPLRFGLSSDGSGPIAVNGIVFRDDATALRIRYQDDTTSVIPVVWVSAPIGAGFFLYPIPAVHCHPGHYPADLELLDASGQTIATVRLPHGAPQPQSVHTIPGFGRMAVPRQAIFAKRRLLFEVIPSPPISARRAGSRPVGLWIAPAHGGGTCLWTNGSGTFGCTQHPIRVRTPLPIEPNFYTDTLCCQVGAGVARVELRFQHGNPIELYPKDSYLLATIPPSDYAPGRRLTEEIAYNRAGQAIGTRTLNPIQPGNYPCVDPSVHVDGLTLCP